MTATEQPEGRADRAHTSGAWSPPSPGSGTVGASDPAAMSTGSPSGDDRSFGEWVQSVLDRAGVDARVPFDSPADAVRWWFRPLADVGTWRALGAALAMALVAPLFFGLTVAIVAVTGAASLAVIGLLLVAPAFAAIRGFSSVGRWFAGWAVESSIPPRDTAPTRPGVLGPVTSRLTDETRWRDVGYVLLDVLVAPLFLAVSLVPLSMAVGSFGSIGLLDGDLDPFDLFGLWIGASFGGVLFGIPMLGLVARLALVSGRWRHRYTSSFIGPDRRAELADRVEELSVQRDQVLDAVAAERRRIERNLHDGVQQQLVALGIDIGRAARRLDDDPEGARQLLDEARDKVRASIGELRLIGRGLHPAVLDDRGLDAALSAVVAGAPIPISVEIASFDDHAGPDGGGLPGDVAETAYYVSNEAITNVLKYAGARTASIRVEPDPGLLPAVRVSIHDDGRGGADEARGSGIAGMRARVEAVDGAFRIDSPDGGPTVVTAVIPLRRERRSADALDDSTDGGSQR